MKSRAIEPSADAVACVATQVAQLPSMSMESIWALWDQHFDQRPNHHHRTFIESRLAYAIQARAFGGLSVATRRRLEKIGETGVVPRLAQRAANQLHPGTELLREYGGATHRVLVRGHADFEFEGRRYKSLSAIARTITGTQWSGPAFFGLKTSKGGEA